jgi:hypothetical protein
MTMKLTRLTFRLGLVLLAVSIAGCGQSGLVGDIVDQVISLPENAKAYVTKLTKNQHGEELVISGKVNRAYHYCCDKTKGHIDIAVFDSEGLVIDTISTLFSPRNIPKAKARTSKFKVALPLLLPEGSTIRAVYHDGIYHLDSGEKTFQCDLNLAIPELQASLADDNDVY